MAVGHRKEVVGEASKIKFESSSLQNEKLRKMFKHTSSSIVDVASKMIEAVDKSIAEKDPDLMKAKMQYMKYATELVDFAVKDLNSILSSSLGEGKHITEQDFKLVVKYINHKDREEEKSQYGANNVLTLRLKEADVEVLEYLHGLPFGEDTIKERLIKMYAKLEHELFHAYQHKIDSDLFDHAKTGDAFLYVEGSATFIQRLFADNLKDALLDTDALLNEKTSSLEPIVRDFYNELGTAKRFASTKSMSDALFDLGGPYSVGNSMFISEYLDGKGIFEVVNDISKIVESKKYTDSEMTKLFPDNASKLEEYAKKLDTYGIDTTPGENETNPSFSEINSRGNWSKTH